MRTSQAGVDLIKQFEGYRGTRYLDAVGVPTIGYGTTAAVVNPVPATCTPQQAEQWLRTSLQRTYEPPVNQLGVPLNQNQFDALVSFTYNLGPGILGTGTTMGQRLRARDWKGASAAFMLYVNAGGRPLQGLINRRAAERKLFDTPVTATPAPKPPATPAPTDVAVARMADGRAEVFVQRESGEVLHRWNVKGGGWSAWSSLGTPGA